MEGKLVLPGSVSRAALHLNLTSFVEALERVDLLDALEAQEEVTVFAFNNTAPANGGSVEDNELDSILQLSIVPDRAIYSTNWNTTAFDLNGTTLDLSAQNGRYFVNDVPVLGLDIFLNNGVMHVLEGVLSPGGTGAGTSDRGDATRIQTPTIEPSPEEGSEDPLTSVFTDTPTEAPQEDEPGITTSEPAIPTEDSSTASETISEEGSGGSSDGSVALCASLGTSISVFMVFLAFL